MGKFKEFLDKYLPENDKREGCPTHEEAIANPATFRAITEVNQANTLKTPTAGEDQSSFAGHIALSGEDVSDGGGTNE